MADNKPTIPIVADSLALALVVASDAPILLLDGELVVVAASASFARAFQIEAASMPGTSLFALGQGEWDVPQLRALLKSTLSGLASVEAYEMDLARPGRDPRRLVIKAQQLDYDDATNFRLLVAVSDVTDARLAERLKDDLLREKAILFQELQHRVANSLQIIASVLMQTARRVPSPETKGHLFDAHNRVMSVAALQRQLAASSEGEVKLRAYFNELCESIGASMISDRGTLKLEVKADDVAASADVSVSLGLIVTELVINALKHAFPAGRGGHILVSYEDQGPDWALTVSDDGVGMPDGPAAAKAGLGTGIVQALAKQLGAKVEVVDADPGTCISVSCKMPFAGARHPAPALAV
jgi:two-component sensor histidine kinase